MDKKSWAILFLIIIHAVGVVGILSPFASYFLPLTPINLLLSLAFLIWFQSPKSRSFFIIMAIIMISGFMIEVLGVNTGWPFGDYTYGKPLGPKIFETPLMIGVNWFILSYCGAMLFRRATSSRILNAIFTGLAITAFDMILEPVAIKLNFWTWDAGQIPIQNYITWTICISIFAYIFYSTNKNNNNSIAPWVLAIQVVFFLSLLIGIQL